jgi:hypothetical protein
MTNPPDPSRCALCGGPNFCGVAAGKGTCWCFSRPVPEAVLAVVPEELEDEFCVCEKCAVAVGQIRAPG